MRLSLNAKLLTGIATLVIASGLIISVLATLRYAYALEDSARSHGQYLSRSIALEAVDKILINDLVALHKILNDQIATDPSVAYLFIVRDDRILTHTFSEGVPIQLIGELNFKKE